MIIDAHNHCPWHGHDAGKIVANMDQFGIDKCWLLTWDVPPEEFNQRYVRAFDARHDPLGMPLAGALEGCRQFPDRFVLGYAPDPRIPGARQRLESAVEMYGVRVYGELKLRMCMDNPDALDMYWLCGELGLPVTFHIDVTLPRYKPTAERQFWYCYDIDALERVLKLCPKTTFLGHAPGFWRELSGDADEHQDSYPRGPVTPGGKLVRLLREYPNLWCDLSAGSALIAISRDRDFGREFLLEFQDRCLYARDQFDNEHQDYLRSLDLPEDALDKIFSGNALRLVPLD